METLFDKLGGRKFLLTLIIIGVGALVEVFGKNGLSQNFVALLLGAAGVFGAANAAITLKHGGQVDATTAGATTGDEANAKADILAPKVEELINDIELTQDTLVAMGDAQAQLRTELETQAKGLALATKLIKSSMKVNV